MKIKIEIVTGYSTYSSLIWTKEDQEQYPTHPDYQHEDDQEYFKQLQEIRKAPDYDDKESIAYDLLMGGGSQDCMMIEPYFSRIEVSYPDGEHQDEEIRPDDEVSNNWLDLSDFYEGKINDPNNLVVILRADHMKRGYFSAEIESDKPFNINYLSVMDQEISYGMHTIEYEDGGEGYDSETQIYCDTDGEED